MKEKAFNTDIDESWSEWAIEMMCAGYEVDSLYQLAGISKPFNQFELQELTNKVLKDLQLDYSNERKVVFEYVYYLIKLNLNKIDKYYEMLKEFKDMYYELDMDIGLQNLVSLYWAKNGLLSNDFQYYWDGADKANIDKIIKEQT